MDLNNFLEQNFNINKKVIDYINGVDKKLLNEYNKIDEIEQFNQYKVISAMQKNKLSDIHFAGSTGYGYNDIGRDTVEKIYADIFKTEDGLVRAQIVSGTHALNIALSSNLKHGDELLSPVGKPYDTLEKVIGIKKSKNSLIDNGIIYKQVDLLEDDSFDYDKIEQTITNKTKLVTIQRSKGYSLRHSLTVAEIKELIKFIKSINKNIICMVDNCYGEFVDYIEPSEVGADLVVGSLIKNPGGGLAPVGGYICGKAELIENASIRLTAPGLSKDVGPSLGISGQFLQGLFLAPSVVSASLKSAIFASYIFEKLDFTVTPKYNEKRSDIVQAIVLGNEKKIVAFCEGIQMAAPVDSYVSPVPDDMPGYDAKIIMAAGAFVQGSSIELSADAPIKEPYAVYLQGGLTKYHGKLGTIIALNNMLSKGLIDLN